MKKLITFLLLAGWFLTTYSQNVVQLEETTLTFEPTGQIVFEDYKNGVVKVKENYQAQFQSNAIAFVKENFDINRFRKEAGFDSGSIYVTVTSANGILNAVFNEKNELVRTFQKFTNIALPYEIRNEVYAKHEGWTITKDKYVASGFQSNINSEKYIVHLKKGKDRERLKITPARSSVTGVAMVEKF